jgi:hypothetical protein
MPLQLTVKSPTYVLRSNIRNVLGIHSYHHGGVADQDMNILTLVIFQVVGTLKHKITI